MSQKCIFIGFGKQAQEYAKVFKILNIKISSIFVRNKKKYNKFKEEYSIDRIETDLSTCLKKSNYDFIMVMLPWNIIEIMLPIVIKNSKKKIIFSEKPVALSLKKLSYLTNICAKYNKNVYVLYNRRFYEVFKITQKYLKNNRLLNFEMTINENEKELIKKKSRKIIGNIRYHITSHWIDLVMWLLKIKNFKVIKFNNSYTLISDKNYQININYKGGKPISMKFDFKNFTLKTKSLEKLYLIKKNKEKLIINEKKMINFNPGILNLAKSIKRLSERKKIDSRLLNLKDLKNLYRILNYLRR